MKRYWKEIKNPKQDKEYWVVFNPQDKMTHYFETKEMAFEYSSWNNIQDINVFRECFN